MIKKINKFINDNRDGIVSAAPIVSSAFGIKQGTVGQIGSAIGSLIPGPAGVAVQAASQFAGTGDHRTVNELTGEIEGDNGTGIIGGIQKLFGWGRSTNSLINKQNRIKTSLADQQLTQDLNYNFYSDPNNSMNGSIFATAAEGGIMRQPVDALVSKGELIYDPVQKKLTKVPGNKGKANTDDDVFTKLREGWIVVPNSDNSKKLTTNNKTVAYNLEPMVDKPNIKMSKGTIEARDRIIKKVSRLTEAIKDEPQEYAMYSDGTGKDGASRKTLFDQRGRNSTLGRWLRSYDAGQEERRSRAIQQFFDFVRNGGEYRVKENGGVDVKHKDGKWYSYVDTFDFDTRDLANVNKSKKSKYITSDVLQKAKDINKYGIKLPEKSFDIIDDDIHANINNSLSSYNVMDFYGNETNNGVNESLITTKSNDGKTPTGTNKISKPSSGKNNTTSRVVTSTASSPEDTVVRRPVYEEPVKVADTPVDDTKVYGREGDVRYDYLAPERKVNPAELGRSVDSDINHNGSDWRDGLYRMAVLSQPLWGREKAEPVDYTSPVYKYMPTAIDVSSQLESADQNYALSRYNFANLYPNTGAGMAASLQAASNRAKQYADVRQWQTNAQNELIGKNAGIYNNWSNEHARILNDVRNKYAQNRATARNINRQNMATALNNYGVMLSDDKKMNIEAQNNQLKANMLKPFIESVYENSDELIPMLAPYTMNRNVKKKSSTR